MGFLRTHNPGKRALLFLSSDLALEERILKINKKKQQKMPHFKIRSCSARSDLKNKSARFSGKIKAQNFGGKFRSFFIKKKIAPRNSIPSQLHSVDVPLQP